MACFPISVAAGALRSARNRQGGSDSAGDEGKKKGRKGKKAAESQKLPGKDGVSGPQGIIAAAFTHMRTGACSLPINLLSTLFFQYNPQQAPSTQYILSTRLINPPSQPILSSPPTPSINPHSLFSAVSAFSMQHEVSKHPPSQPSLSILPRTYILAYTHHLNPPSQYTHLITSPINSHPLNYTFASLSPFCSIGILNATRSIRAIL